MAHFSVTGYDANGQRVQNTGTPTAATDAVPQGYIAYDLGNIGQSGKPDASALWLDFVAVRKFSLAAAFAGSVAIATTAATAQTVFTVSRNGTQIGTITFAANGTQGTFAAANAVTIVPGDRLQISTPSTQDSTLAGVTITLAALRAI